MFNYLIRRILYAIPIIIGVNFLTFVLFFMMNSPEDMARLQLGEKHVTVQEIERWKHSKGYDKPLFINSSAKGHFIFTDTLFFNKSMRLFAFNFGSSNQGRDINLDVTERMWPSLALAVPSLFIGIIVNISFALWMIFFRESFLDTVGIAMCVAMMSISSLFYIIAGQFLFAKVLQWVPISGYEGGLSAIKFLILPMVIGVVSGVGAGARWYRSLFLEELNKEYVRTARAKGLGEVRVLFVHVLKNAMIPILTGVVAILPLLFMGSLLMESFFAIPGLGSYTIDAIAQQDFDIVRVMVFLGTVFYILGLVLTDVAYTLVDPRIRL